MSNSKTVTIAPPNFQTAVFTIRGTAPLVQHKFSKKAKVIMREAQEAGSTKNKGKKREPKNFQEDYEQAMYVSREGWNGVPAPSFRNAMIAACRLVGFTMTHAKLSVFVEADGFDEEDGTPLVRITKGEPRIHEGPVILDSGVADIRWRPMWEEWEAILRVRFDGDQFTLTDVANLLMRAGLQCGVQEGRPNSKRSNGVGWGMFTIVEEEE